MIVRIVSALTENGQREENFAPLFGDDEFK